MAACGVGYVDALVALGRYQVKPPLPHSPGQEASGWVEALGDGVTGLAPGDRVMATVAGGFAEFAAAPAASVIRLPERMTFAQAAGFRINYLTALHGLRDRGAVRAGETVAVLGAAGGLRRRRRPGRQAPRRARDRRGVDPGKARYLPTARRR